MIVNPNAGAIRPPTPAPPAAATGPARGAREDARGSFAAALRDQLEKVGAMQNEADANVQRLLTGESDSVTDVFVAARKAQVAFTLLMQIRNKLVEAYQELQNMRV